MDNYQRRRDRDIRDIAGEDLGGPAGLGPGIWVRWHEEPARCPRCGYYHDPKAPHGDGKRR